MKRTRVAAAATAALAVVASVGVLTASSASADDTLGSGLQSISLSAVAGGQRILADTIAGQSPGTVDSGVPEAEATMTASSGHALASVVWPTALAGNAGTLLFLLGPYPCTPSQYQPPLPPVQPQCSPVGTPEDVMNQYHYLNSPVRAEAMYPVKPADDNSIPGATMTARAEDSRVSADAILGAAYSSDIEKFSSARATSLVKLTGVASASADASSSIAGIELAGGEITIGSVMSVVHGETDGVRATSRGFTTVTDMKVHDIPVSIDDKGVHVKDQTADAVGPAAAVVNQIFENFGVKMFVTRPTQENKGGVTTFSAGSLIVDWFPPGAPGGITFEFGGAHITAAVTLPLTFDDVTAVDDSTFAGAVFDGSTGSPGDVPFTTDVAGATITPLGRAPRRAAAGTALALQPAVTAANLPGGVSAWWMVLGLIGVLSLAAGLRRLPDRVLEAGGPTCGDGT